MQTKLQTEAAGRRRSVPANLLSVIRGDKYMADAYRVVAPGGAASPSPTMKER